MINKEDVLLAKQGDVESMEKIVTEYKNLIYMRNKNLFLKGADRDDLVQEGMIGLMKAIKSFDENKSACFSTFASLCIKRQIITAVKNYNSEKNRNLNIAIQGEGYSDLEDVIRYSSPSLKYYTPEQIMLGKELVKLLSNFLKESLSGLEKEVFSEMTKGYGYLEIASNLNKDPKAVDNSIQRIKKKVLTFLEEYNKS
ncbi:sigma-70 family RNA polymerase sigma factor [Cetobacterium sp. 8H]|uniref:sigma-70 family RNA polymerase sigma factor n=1 Tax=Cetobacterium sp. 8H TaxID=2759681 RepID=UPI00163C60A2|nr:sigma-70 family RNA polymerase sigma factor [Cetobacterium sp. 8H]MBC2851637.1 sigma-70 family RNA polymerase sigma factor [Cetobacterium sp. 8H]